MNTYRLLFVMLCAQCALVASGFADIQVSHIDLTSADDDLVFTVSGAKDYDNMALSVCTADLNGDGYDDAVLGADHASVGYATTGAVYVVFGNAELRSVGGVDLKNPPDNVLAIYGEQGGDRFGSWVVSGDFDADGYGDILIPALNADPFDRINAGMGYILFGSSGLSALSTIEIASYTGRMTRIAAAQEGDNLGFLATTGDINGDGYDDALIRAYLANPVGRHSATTTHIIYGGPDLAQKDMIDLRERPEGTLTIIGAGENDRLGWGVGTSDVNGDGYDEILIGSRLADYQGQRAVGVTRVIFGFADIADIQVVDLADPSVDMLNIYGGIAGEQAGNIVVGGDIDGDNYGDIVINALESGNLYVVFGSPGMAGRTVISLDESSEDVLRIEGTQTGAPSIGDINGDGIDDINVGTPFISRDVSGNAYEGNTGGGVAIFGSTFLREVKVLDLTFPSVSFLLVTGKYGGAVTGFRTATGDINGDGYSDALMTAHEADPLGRHNAGEVYWVWGGSSWDTGPSVIGARHFSFYINTGNNASIVVPASANPTVYGEALAPGDEIGVFTQDGVCAGAGIWTGYNLGITAWGDNLYEDGVNGFDDGEPYMFRIWRQSENAEYVANVEFAQGADVYHIDGMSVVESLTVGAVSQQISLSGGWNLVSSNVVPSDNRLSAVLGEAADSITLMKNGRGELYWPEWNIDNIGRWDVLDGYQVYAQEAVEFEMVGREVLPSATIYDLPSSWSLISYTGVDGMAPEAAFEPANGNIAVVLNGRGEVYWPEYSTDQIRQLNHGEGYWVNMSSASSFNYPSSSPGAPAKSAVACTTAHFAPMTQTGSYSLIMIPRDTLQPVGNVEWTTGDEIAVFTPAGLCAAAAVIDDGNCSVTVWGDNDITDETDGFLSGERYSFVMWDAETGEEVEVNASYMEGLSYFTPRGISVVDALGSDVITSIDDDRPGAFSLDQNYPNPFNPRTTISFTIQDESHVTLSVYNVVGERIATLVSDVLTPGKHSAIWSGESVASGVYIYRLEAGAFRDTKRMLLIK